MSPCHVDLHLQLFQAPLLILDLRGEGALLDDHVLQLHVAQQQRVDAAGHGQHRHDAHRGKQRLHAVLTAASLLRLGLRPLARLLLAALALGLCALPGVALHGAVVDLGVGEPLGRGLGVVIGARGLGAAAVLAGPRVLRRLLPAGTALPLLAPVGRAAGGRLLRRASAAAHGAPGYVVVIGIQARGSLVHRHGNVLLTLTIAGIDCFKFPAVPRPAQRRGPWRCGRAGSARTPPRSAKRACA